MPPPDVTREAYRNAYRRAFTLPRRAVPYRITFALDLFNGTGDRQLSRDTLDVMLKNLLEIDMLYLRHHPEVPNLYAARVRYMEEPPGQEDWQDIPTTLRLGIGDCLPLDTLVVKEGYRLAPLGSLLLGDRILANGTWVSVREIAFTGVKPILHFRLANGATLEASHEHRLFLKDGREIRAKAVRTGDILLSPTMNFPASESTTHRMAALSIQESTAGKPSHVVRSRFLALHERLLRREQGEAIALRTLGNPLHNAVAVDPSYLGEGMRVLGITDAPEAYCGDITVEGGVFYLPESDALVHNCEDLACWRAAEYRVRENVLATPIFKEQKRADGSYLYHIVVSLPPSAKYPHGAEEDPSRILGMR